MANRNFDDLQALEKKIVLLCGNFAPNGSSAPTGLVGKGIASVARTSAGLFTITLEDTYVGAYHISASLALSAADDKFLQIGLVDVTSAKTIQIIVWDVSGAAATDVAANAANKIYFNMMLKNSAV